VKEAEAIEAQMKAGKVILLQTNINESVPCALVGQA
jgi:hypothetical protein